MKSVIYTKEATAALKRYGNMAARIRKAVDEYGADPKAHANNVIKLAGSGYSRMRVGDFRVIFDETDSTIEVLDLGPGGGIYD